MTVLADVVRDIKARVDDLRPAVDEHAELVEALSKLNGAGLTESLEEPAKTVGGRKQNGNLGRPRGANDTRDRVLRIVQANPGIRGGAINTKLGRPRSATGVYGVLRRLRRDGLVRSVEGGWEAR